VTPSLALIYAVGEPAFIFPWRFLILEAKAIWELTCIAGGLFVH